MASLNHRNGKCNNKPKKKSGFQRDSNPWPLVIAAVLYHLSYEDPYNGIRPVSFINCLITVLHSLRDALIWLKPGNNFSPLSEVSYQLPGAHQLLHLHNTNNN